MIAGKLRSLKTIEAQFPEQMDELDQCQQAIYRWHDILTQLKVPAHESLTVRLEGLLKPDAEGFQKVSTTWLDDAQRRHAIIAEAKKALSDVGVPGSALTDKIKAVLPAWGSRNLPKLGLATTGDLLAELKARAEVNGTISYKTVGDK